MLNGEVTIWLVCNNLEACHDLLHQPHFVSLVQVFQSLHNIYMVDKIWSSYTCQLAHSRINHTYTILQ